ncbi:MAG TPA: hypothetical protein VNV85_02935 [Puia sp.]|nr:hypothetical protein [Puia sp.]
MSESVLKFPVSVIRVVKVDDAGQIWFCIPTSVQPLQQFGEGFYSMLQFFRKGENFYLKIQGKAFIIHNEEQINNIHFLPSQVKNAIISGGTALVKVQIQFADYFESQPLGKRTERKNFSSHVYNLFFKPYQPPLKSQRIFLIPVN